MLRTIYKVKWGVQDQEKQIRKLFSDFLTTLSKIDGFFSSFMQENINNTGKRYVDEKNKIINILTKKRNVKNG